MPDVVKKQTIKQAKASYKSRGRPSLSEKESRQLERALELEQRAERAKEAEKRRQEAAKKKAEAEKRQQSEKQRLQLGSQRRYDRFGYKSSQFHLGAFFGQKSVQTAMKSIEALREESADGFDDDDLDDDSLLEALDRPGNQKTPQRITDSALQKNAISMPPPAPPALRKPLQARSEPITKKDDDLSVFFDELGSSTQIARELDSDDDDEFGEPPDFRHVSFSSGSLDLTEEDLEMLDPPQTGASAASHSKVAVFRTSPKPTNITAYTSKEAASGRHRQSAPNKPPNEIPQADTSVTTPAAKQQQRMQPPTLPMPRISRHATADRTLQPQRENKAPPQRPLPTSVQPRPSNGATSHVSQQMPPPRLPMTKTARTTPFTTTALRVPEPRHQPRNASNQQGPPTPSTHIHDASRAKRSPPAIRGPFLPASSLYCSPDLGFTMTQLESLVDDDLQLTQVA